MCWGTISTWLTSNSWVYAGFANLTIASVDDGALGAW